MMLCIALSMDLFVLCVACLTEFVTSKECVCCACGPSERLDAPSICVLCFCMPEVVSSFRSLRAGSQVFALLMLFLCVILHTMFSGKSMQFICILPFDMLCLSVLSVCCRCHLR